MDVRSDTPRKDWERTNPRDTESGKGFQQVHGEPTEMLQECDEKKRCTRKAPRTNMKSIGPRAAEKRLVSCAHWLEEELCYLTAAVLLGPAVDGHPLGVGHQTDHVR